jgi:hypothetical protein
MNTKVGIDREVDERALHEAEQGQARIAVIGVLVLRVLDRLPRHGVLELQSHDGDAVDGQDDINALLGVGIERVRRDRPLRIPISAGKGYFGTPCFHLSQWATTSLMNGAAAAHRLLMEGTKPPELPSGPQPQSECQADSPG